MTLVVRNPYDGAVVREIEHDDDVAIEAKLAASAGAQPAWARRPVRERAAAVEGCLRWFREHADQVARDLTTQMGKPIAQSRNEIAGMLERAEHMIAIAEESLAPDVLPAKDDLRRRIEHVPLGVVVDLAAWNYPLLIPVNVVVPALLAGNGVLLKHSAVTPLCGEHFAAAFEPLGGLFAHVVLDHDRTERLVRDPRVGHVSFTGSVEGGRAVQGAARERFVDVGLELGGKDAAYVAADADLEAAVAGVVDGACYNAGQSCCGVERVYVHASVYDELLERARVAMGEYRIGDPLEETTTLGPMARASALDFLEAQVADATARGARLLSGGTRDAGVFFPPTLLADCANDLDVMREESFGPVMPVASVADDAEALERMNDSAFGLTASVWTTSPERAETLAAELDVGTVYQNRCDVLDPALPWTGVKDSGRGSTLSRYGFQHLTRRKAIHFRTG